MTTQGLLLALHRPIGAATALTPRSLASNTATSGTSGVNTLSVSPTGHAVDDWMLFTVVSVGGTTGHSSVAGGAVNVVPAFVQSATTVVSVWKKKITTTSTDTYTFGLDTGVTHRMDIYAEAWSGGDPTDIIEQAPAAVGTQGQSLGVPAVTPQGTGRVHLIMGGVNRPSGTAVSFNALTNYTKDVELVSAHATNANAVLARYRRALPDGSAVSSQSITISGGVDRQIAGASILLRPSVGGGGGGAVNPMPKTAGWRQRSGTSWTDDMLSWTADFGKPNGHISNYHGAGSAGTLNSAELALIDDGYDFHLYWKIASNWAGVVDGSRDAAIDAAADSFKSRPSKTFWVTFWHEPENDLTSNGGAAGTAAQYRAQWQYAVNRFRARGVTNVKYVWVIMNSSAHTADLDDLWPGNAYVDIVGVQRYIGGTASPELLGQRYLEDLQWFWNNYVPGVRNWRPKKADGTGDIPFAVTETGADLLSAGPRGTTAHRASTVDGVRAVLGDLASWGLLEIRWFGNPQNDFESSTAADGLAWKALVNATLTGPTSTVHNLDVHSVYQAQHVQNVVLVVPTTPTPLPPVIEPVAWWMPTGARNPNNFQTSQVYRALTGQAGSRVWSFRYELLTNTHRRIRDLEEVKTCVVEHQYLADIKRKATFTIRDLGGINYLTDRIRPIVRLRLPPFGINDWVEWPLGVFLLAAPMRHANEVDVVTREVEGYDPMQALADDKVATRYVAAAGANVINTVATLVAGASPTWRITRATETLRAAKEWPPGTSKLVIANSLLAVAGYESISFDSEGRGIIQPYQSPDERSPMWDYNYGDESLVVPNVDQELDLFSIPNKWVAVVSEPDQTLLTASYTNSNPASPTSTVRRGRTIVEVLEEVEASSQTVLNNKVKRAAFAASQIYEHLTFETSLIPFHGTNDTFNFKYDPLAIDAKYSQTAWTITCEAGVPMRHEARRIVSV